MLSCGSTKAKTVAVMSSLAFEVFCCLTYIFSKAAVVFGKISHEDYTWERDYLTRTRKSPTVRIKINFSANAKCQSRARRREKSPAFFDHCTPDDNSALAIWKIPGISWTSESPYSPPLVDIWDNFYMHDLQLTTMVTICKACEGSSIDRNLLSTLAEKVSLNALKATEQIYTCYFPAEKSF